MKIFNFFNRFFQKEKSNDSDHIIKKSAFDKYVHLVNENERIIDQYLLKN